MPFNLKQCRLFGARAAKGLSVPKDWKKYCKTPKKGKK